MSTVTLPAPAGESPPPARPRKPIVPRPGSVVVAVLVLVFGSLLAVEAYVSAGFTPDANHMQGDTSEVPPAILNGNAIINTTGDQVNSYGLPEKTIALTFDDGPDPWWTRQVLEVLRRHQAQATFFVVGTQVVRQPALIRQIVASGHEVGLHTFTHPNLATMPLWRQRMEYSQSQMAIAEAAGVKSSLLRLPYSSSVAAIDSADWPVVREAGRLGYLVVASDTDSQDWARPGVDQIVRNMTPTGDQGAVVLLHDAGGDRTQTVAALDRFIPAMRARGYRFTTVTEGLNLALAKEGVVPTRQGVVENPAASERDQWQGKLLAWTVEIADGSVVVLSVMFVVVGLLTLGRTLLIFAFARRHARRRRAADWSWGPPVTAPVSVIVPAYNEKEGIAAAVRSLATGDYPEVEVLVVDDGSTDGTADIVDGLGLPNVRIIRKPNGGKSSALNTGIALARHDLIVMVDGDTIFEPDSIRRLVQPMADPAVGAVSGNVRVGNQASLFARFQHIEYVIGFNLDRRYQDELQCMPTVPGAIGAFRRQALSQVGGLSDDTLAEDTDLTMALCRAGWKVVYEEEARAWTEAPVDLDQLWKQRYRWSYGVLQAMWKHRRAVVERGPSGRFGRRCLPLLAVFGVFLPLLGPVIDVLAIYGLFFLDRALVIGAWLAMLLAQTVTAFVAFRLGRESLRPLVVLPLQQFLYRQVMYLVLMRSMLTALTGVGLRWHKLPRTGEVAVPAQASRKGARA
jgi:cellulose synthase/poly-beta-1,6-N-acetylglucosamine synthase-like glycosyltransferase/peptidoglycan/xylan/chitin deacetylase (PgdA/CDA1 family)